MKVIILIICRDKSFCYADGAHVPMTYGSYAGEEKTEEDIEDRHNR